MKYIFLLPLVLLVACGNLRPAAIVDHKVMVTIPCKTPIVDRPVMPLTDNGSTKDDIFVKTKKALAEINERAAYEIKLEAVIKSCQ